MLLIQILLLFPDIFQRLFTRISRTITNERSSFFLFPRRRDTSSRASFPGVTTAFRRRFFVPVRRLPTFDQIVLSRPFQPRNPMHVQTLSTTLHPVLKLILQVRFPALLTEQNRSADTRHERARRPQHARVATEVFAKLRPFFILLLVLAHFTQNHAVCFHLIFPRPTFSPSIDECVVRLSLFLKLEPFLLSRR